MTMAFVFNQKVLFKHCDPARIVFYPRYFEMINDCVEAWFDERLGAPFEELHVYGGGVPTARIEAAFKAPSRHGDRLAIALHCLKIGRTSTDLSFEAKCGDELRFSAASTLVHIDNDGRPSRWPDPLRQRLTEEMEKV